MNLIHLYLQIYSKSRGMEQMVRQGCINKLIIINIVVFVIKQSGIVGGEHFCNLKLIYLKHLVYGTDRSMELCRGRLLQVNKIEI